MRMVPHSRGYPYIRAACILLLAMVLIVAGVACDDGYRLTISSTEGGSVTIPAEGRSTHEAGTVVELVATPDDGYRFVEWTGDIETIASATSASTTITMDANYSITASFSEQDGGGNGRTPDPIRP